MKKSSSLLIIFAVAILLVAAVRSASSAAQAGKGKKTDTAALYQQHCAKCHLEDGKGIASLEPPDFTDAKWQAARTDKEFIEAINNGKGVMPGLKDVLSAQEVRALVKYVRAFAPATKSKKK
jgi:cbb3-type cytochrome c oxidase subunit III